MKKLSILVAAIMIAGMANAAEPVKAEVSTPTAQKVEVKKEATTPVVATPKVEVTKEAVKPAAPVKKEEVKKTDAKAPTSVKSEVSTPVVK